MVRWIRTTELTVVEHQTLTRPSAKPNWKGIGGPTGHAASDMAQVFHWPPVRRQILGRYAEAKQIGPQPQNTWGNTNLRILQIQFRNKTNTSPTLAVTQVWIMGMDRRYGSHPQRGMDHGYGSWGMDRMWVRGMDRAFKFWSGATYIYIYISVPYSMARNLNWRCLSYARPM